jgi:hypothetical protein
VSPQDATKSSSKGRRSRPIKKSHKNIEKTEPYIADGYILVGVRDTTKVKKLITLETLILAQIFTKLQRNQVIFYW